MFGAGEHSGAPEYIKTLQTAWRLSCRPDSRGALEVAGYSAASAISHAPHAVNISGLRGPWFETQKNTSSSLQIKNVLGSTDIHSALALTLIIILVRTAL